MRRYGSASGEVNAEQFTPGQELPGGMTLWTTVQPRDMSVGYVRDDSGRESSVGAHDWIVTEDDGARYVVRHEDFIKVYWPVGPDDEDDTDAEIVEQLRAELADLRERHRSLRLANRELRQLLGSRSPVEELPACPESADETSLDALLELVDGQIALCTERAGYCRRRAETYAPDDALARSGDLATAANWASKLRRWCLIENRLSASRPLPESPK